MSIAKNLRLLRRIRGLTLEELSEKIGISVSYLSRIESGNRRITDSLLLKLSELLECDPGEILSDDPPEKQIASLGFSSFSLSKKPATEKVSELMGLLEKVAGQLNTSQQQTHKLPLFASPYFKNEFFTGLENTSALLTEQSPAEWVDCPPEVMNVESAFAYYVVNEEMAPRYNPGDTVFVNPQKPIVPGCFVLLVKADGTSSLRQFIRSDTGVFTFKAIHNQATEQYATKDISNIFRVVSARESA